MKLSSFIKSFIVISFISIPQTQAHGSSAIALGIHELQNIRETLLKTALKQLNTINVALEDLAQAIASDSIRQLKNQKRVFTDAIRALRDIVSRVQNHAFTQVDEHSLAYLIHFVHGLTQNLNDALDQGITDLRYFDLEQILAWRPKKEPSLEALQQKLDANNTLLEALKAKTQNAGICWYNKAYRALDNHIIQPALKHDAAAHGETIFWAGLAAFGMWFHFNSDYPRFLRSWVGYAPTPNKETGLGLDVKFHETHPMYKLGDAYWFAQENIRNNAVLFALALPYAKVALSREYDAFKLAAGKNLLKLSNFLKGGTYANATVTTIEDRVEPKYTFDDIVGCEHIKEVLSFVIKYIEDPERFDRAGLTPEKGYLLTGPTRTGKSMTAEALAGEIKKMLKRIGRNSDEFGFYPINASYITQNGISYYLELAKNYAPCIIFIDEIDLLSLQRAGDKKLLGEFLSSMSGCMERDPKKQVIIVAATNKPENMDEALRQRGRFGKELRFDYPTYSERREFLVRMLEKLSINIDTLDIDKIVRETEYIGSDGKKVPFEDLRAIVKNALQQAKVRGRVLTQEQLEQSVDDELRNIISEQDYEVAPQERHLIAIHQAGHAIATVLLGGKYKLAKVTIRPMLAKLREELIWEQYYTGEDQKQKKTIFGKTFTFCEKDASKILTYQDKVDQCKIQLAGHAAETLMFGSTGYSYHPDEPNQVFNQIKALVTEGIDITTMPDNIKTRYMEKALSLQKEYVEAISKVLGEHKDAIAAVAKALEAFGSLTGQEVATLIKDPKAIVHAPEPTIAAPVPENKAAVAVPATPVTATTTTIAPTTKPAAVATAQENRAAPTTTTPKTAVGATSSGTTVKATATTVTTKTTPENKAATAAATTAAAQKAVTKSTTATTKTTQTEAARAA